MQLRAGWIERYAMLLCIAAILSATKALAEDPAPAADPNQSGQPTTRPAPHPDTQKALEKLQKLREQMKHEREKEREARQQAEGDPLEREKAREARGEKLPDAPPVNEVLLPGADRSRALDESAKKIQEAERSAAQKENQRLMEEAPPAPAPAPVAAPPSVESLRERAKASTQRAGRISLPSTAPPVPGQPPELAEAPPAESAGEPPAPGAALPTAPAEVVPDDFIGPPQRLSKITVAGTRPSPHAPGETAPGEKAGEASETAELERRPRDPNEPNEWFNFSRMPWEDVIMHFVERIGKPLMDPDGGLTIGGELTYITTRRFTKDEAIDELNLILHEKGFRFVEREHHIYVIPLADMPQHVPLAKTYPTVEAFEADNPRDMDYVAVYYRVHDRPAQFYVDTFADALPDYSRISALAESNQIKIVALARDVRKFLSLKAMIDVTPDDPRQIRFFDIKTNAAAIERMVRDFLRMPQAAAAAVPRVQMVRDPQTGRMIPQQMMMPGAAGGGADTSEVQMVSDERTNSIIVKATADKLTEIGKLIELFDVKPDIGKFETKVVEVKHADATEVANLIKDIMAQEQGQAASRTPNWQLQQMQRQQQLLQQQQQMQQRLAQQRGRRGQVAPPQLQPQPIDLNVGAAPEEIMVEGIYERAKKTIRLVADSRTNSLIVYANDEGFKRLYEMLEIIDKPLPDKLKTIEPAFAKVSEIAPLVQQLAESIVTVSGSRAAPTILPDEDRNLFYVIAERDQMTKIEELIDRLDVPGQGKVRHIVRLKNLRPSVVAQMVQTLLQAERKGAASTSAGGGPSPGAMIRGRAGLQRPAAGAATATTSDAFVVIALDEAQTLIVECTDDDWARVEGTIRMWDDEAITNTPRLETFAIERGNADAIAATLGNLYRGGFEHPILGRTTPTIQADGQTILVYGIEPAIEEIGALIKQLDVERDSDKIEILPLLNADATQVATQLTQLFAGPRATPRGPGASLPPVIQPEPITNSLVVQADRDDLERIRSFAFELDQKVGKEQPEQKFFVVKYAQPQEVATAVQNIFGATGRGPRGPGGSTGQVKAFASGTQVVVEAPKAKMADIEKFIAQLDDPQGHEIEIKTFKLPGADVNQIATSLSNAFKNRPPRPGRIQPSFQPDPTTEAVIVTTPKDNLEEIESLIRQFATGAEDLTLERKVYPIEFADAAFVANKVGNDLTFQVRQQKGQIVAQRINVTIDERQNQVIINGPRFVHAIAAAMIKELDQVDKRDIRQATIGLVNADAGAVVNTLRPIFQEKARQENQNKSYIPVTLTPDAVTNSIIVYGGDEADHLFIADEIARMDATAAEQDVPPTLIPLEYADPQQVATMLNGMFKGGSGRNQQKDVQVTVSNNQLVVKATRKRLEEIKALVAQLDSKDSGENDVQIKTYDLKVLNAGMVQLAVAGFLRDVAKQTRPGALKPGAFAEPTTNTLVVLAPPDAMPFIDGLIASLESKGPRAGEARSYDLMNVRADAIAQNVDGMLKARIAEREGARQSKPQTAVFGMADTNRLFVFAPPEYQQLAAELIKMVDQPAATGEVTHIVPLNDGDASQLAQSIMQLVQSKAQGKGGVAPVRVSSDAGSNSIIISGLAKDVAEIEKWVAELETNSVRVPELQTFTLKYAAPGSVKEMLEKVFGAAGKNPQDAVTITENEYSGQLIITANRRKMRQVEKYIEQLDQKPDESESGLLAGGKKIYFVDINRGDASDIAWDVRDQFPDEDKGGPSIEADWYGEFITVKCRESEFESILSLIREYEKRAKVERKVVTRKLTDPRVLDYLKGRVENLEIVEPPRKQDPNTLIEELWKEGEEPQAVKDRRARAEREGANGGGPEEFNAPRRPKPATPPAAPPPAPTTRPGQRADAVPRMTPAHTRQVLSEIETEVASASRPAAHVDAPNIRRVVWKSAEAETVAPERPAPLQRANDLATTPTIRLAQAPAPAESAPATQPAAGKPIGERIASPFPKEAPKLITQPDGSVIVEGPKDAVDELIDIVEKLEEDLAVGEVIRIFKFRYGDVTAAAEILSLMFDVQQRQINIPQLQQQQQRGPQGRQGDQGREGERDQQSLMEQMRSMVGGRDQKGAKQRGQLRMATDPGHNYLIIRCEQNQLPEIRQLLRELDIPPGEVQVKVIQLKNLVAEETADNIKAVLGIERAQQRRGAAPQRGLRGGQNPQQAQLMEMLQQQLVSVPGVEGGAKVERVEIVANPTTNSLLISSPPEVLDLIERVIGELEELESRTVVGIHYYKLENAKVADVEPLLSEIFEGAGTSGGGRVRGGEGAAGLRRGGGGASPAAMGPVTISSDPRTNTIIFTAENKDVPLVESHIKRLDLAGAVAEAEMYVCEYGDAEAIVAAVEPLFATGGGGRRGPTGGDAGPGEIRLSADSATNTILVWGPLDKRDLVFSQIEQLDKLSRNDFKEIPVVHADAEKLATTLSQLFSDAGGAAPRPQGRRGRMGAAGGAGGISVASTGRVTILGDKNARKLLVRAPEETFRQIQSLAETLDQPSTDLQVKSFQLRHAQAPAVVDSVKAALAEYLQLASQTGAETDFGAFTAMPDARTNSIAVVGDDKIFMFVAQILSIIDVPTPPEARKNLRVFPLDRSNATTVADAINAFAAGGGTSGGGGGGRRGPLGGATPGSGREVDVSAVAEEATNTVIVFGKAEDIDLVETEIISRLEDAISSHMQIATIEVRYVPASQLVSYISQFLDQRAAQAGGGRGGRGGAAEQTTGARLVPNDDGKAIVVRGSKRQIEEIRDLVQRFDSADFKDPSIKVIPIPTGQDAVRLATDIQRIINDSEKTRAEAGGRPPRQVTVGGDEYTNSLIVAGDPALYGTVQTLVDQLSEIRKEPAITRIIELKNLSADAAEQIVNQLQQNKRGGSGSSPRRSSSGTGGGSIRRPTGGSTPAPGMRSGGSSSPAPAPAPAPSAPPRRPRTTTPPAGGERPRQTPPTGGGGWIMPSDVDRALERPFALLQPVVAVTPIAPLMLLAAFEEPATPPAPQARPIEARRAMLKAVLEEVSEEPQPVTTRPAARTSPEAAPAEDKSPRPAQTQDKAAKPAKVEPKVAVETVGEEPDTAATAPATQPDGLSGVSGALRGDVTAAAIDSQRLVITGDESDVEFIENVLRMMEFSTPAPAIEVFQLKEAKATALAPIIEKAIKAQIEVKGRAGPGDQFSINAEGRSNSLIVAANEVIMDRIAELIDRLDIARAGEGVDFRTVPLQFMRAAQAVQILRPQIERLNKMREVPTDSAPTISPIDATNSVLIIGTPPDAAEIQRLIEAIDVDVSIEDDKRPGSFVSADVIIVGLKNGKAEDVAQVLTDLIEEQQENARNAAGADKAAAPYVRKLKLRLADGRELPELDLERPIKVIAEKGTNSLIIFSSKKNNEALQAIVDIFDTLPLGEDTDVKAFALRHAAAEDVAKLVTDVFKEKTYLLRPSEGFTGSPPSGQLPPVPPGVAAKGLPFPLVVQSDARTNTVVVVGRRDAVVLAGGLIAELDRPTAELGLKAHVLELKRQQAQPLSEKLKDLLDERVQALGGDKNKARDSAVIQPDERANALIIFATEEMYDLIEDLVLQLDTAKKFAAVDVKYRPLKHADAPKIQKILEDTFDSRQEAEQKLNPDSTDTLKIMADTRSNSLVLTGTLDYLDDAEKLILELDKPNAPTVVFTAKKVKLNSAPNVAGLLKEMVDKALSAQDSNLKGTPIHVAADPVTDTLLLAAAQEDMDILTRWVEILDRPSEVGRLTRIFPLKRAVAEDVVQSIQEVYQQQGGGEGGGKIEVSAVADKGTNSVVAFGPPALLKDVENFVKQLDGVEPTKSTTVRIFKLEQAAAEEAGELLNRILSLERGTVGGRGGGGAGQAIDENAKQVMLIFQRQHPELGLETLKAMRSEIVVISDVRTNALVVTAPPASMPLMESLVEAVDVPPQDAKIRIFRLRNADAQQLVETLQQLFERRNAARTGGGDTQDSERVLALGEGAAGGRQEIAFTTDRRTNSVIAAGTPGYLDLVQEMIVELDTVPIKDRVTFVYEPRNITAEALSNSLREFSDAEQQRLEEIGDDISTQVKQERRISAIYNEDANRVIIDVDPRFRSEVMKVIEDLDQQPLQVIIQVLILEVSIDNELDLGVEFAAQDLQWTAAGENDTTTFDYVVGTDIGAAGSGLGGFTFTITGRDFNFLMRTLQVEGNLRVLSRPQIVAMNNKEAKIDVSNDVPYVNGTQTSTTGQIATSVARQKVGIILEVTPQINPDGFVRMEIRQEVSQLTDSTVPVAPGVTSPIFFTREAETTITVRDNETVVLGGLIESRESNSETKVPLVGDIPILGTLFRTQNDQTTRRELLLVLTPRVVRSSEEYRQESLMERDRLKLMWGELLEDPLLETLRIQRGEAPPVERREHWDKTPAPPTEPRREPEIEPQYEEYGPVRPALRTAPVDGDPTSYDVPITRRTTTP